MNSTRRERRWLETRIPPDRLGTPLTRPVVCRAVPGVAILPRPRMFSRGVTAVRAGSAFPTNRKLEASNHADAAGRVSPLGSSV